MTQEQPKERAKPGPKTRYGERKPMLTRVDPELAAEFEGYCAAAKGGPISVTEGLQKLIEEFCKRKREALNGKKPERPASAGPAPKSVTITALLSAADLNEEQLQEVKPINKPSTPSKSSPWSVLSQKIKEWCGTSDAWEIWLSSLEFVSLENCKLALHVPNPFFVDEVQERFGEGIEALASELCGEPIKLSLSVSPQFEMEQRRDLARIEAEKEAKQKAAEERVKKVEVLKALYLKQTAEAARQAEILIFEDDSLLGLLNSFQRKQVENWLSGVSAGASYQTGKEDKFRGPRGRNR